MTKADRIIADLINALDAVKREAEKPEASRHFIVGLATQAMANCDAQRERNTDGYLVSIHDRAIDSAVYNGVQEAWRICGATIDLSDDAILPIVQETLVTAIRNGL